MGGVSLGGCGRTARRLADRGRPLGRTATARADRAPGPGCRRGATPSALDGATRLRRRRPGRLGTRRLRTVWLEPLAAETTESLVDSLLGSNLPGQVRTLIVERAEGNPFFIEEVLGNLIDAGVLQRENGGWRAGELPTGFEIPDSVQAVLASRIDLL